MKRKIHLNEVPNVNLYSNEGTTNPNNCATGCSGCNTSGGDDVKSSAVVAAVITATAIIIAAASNPEPPVKI